MDSAIAEDPVPQEVTYSMWRDRERFWESVDVERPAYDRKQKEKDRMYNLVYGSDVKKRIPEDLDGVLGVKRRRKGGGGVCVED